MEKTFAMIKPSGVQRNLIGNIISRIENKGFMIHGIKFLQVSKKQAELHYDIHKGKPFYDELITSITAGPVVAIVVSGNNAVEILRLLAGATNPTQALPGTIRGDFSNDIGLNVIHTSDSVERALYEIGVYFTDDELVEYNKVLNNQVYS